MRRITRSSLCVVLLGLLIVPAMAQRREYFTETELDNIRDAQELNLRIPAYFKLAERRLITLGLMNKTDKELEKAKKEQEQYEKEKAKAGPKAGPIKPPVDDLAYLKDFSRTELLRGYTQALTEIMDNIDDAYEQKKDVRGPLEAFEKFTRETRAIVAKFEAKTAVEKTALQEALDRADEANNGAKDALKKVPKTEKKPPLY